MPRIFISYSHRDTPFVSKFETDLNRDHDVVIDHKDIVPTIPLMQQIGALISVCDYFVPIISNYSVRSRWVQQEIGEAFERAFIHPKMLKLELDGQPLLVEDPSLRVVDDLTYVSPGDGVFQYRIPPAVQRRGFIKSMEIVLGSGRIHDLVLRVRFA